MSQCKPELKKNKLIKDEINLHFIIISQHSLTDDGETERLKIIQKHRFVFDIIIFSLSCLKHNTGDCS